MLGALLALLALAGGARAARLMAIDLGGEFMKVQGAPSPPPRPPSPPRARARALPRSRRRRRPSARSSLPPPRSFSKFSYPPGDRGSGEAPPHTHTRTHPSHPLARGHACYGLGGGSMLGEHDPHAPPRHPRCLPFLRPDLASTDAAAREGAGTDVLCAASASYASAPAPRPSP